MSLTWVPVWFWCIRRGAPCGWSWSPPRRESHRGRWPVPRGQTASCPERRHYSLDRRGRSDKNHSPSQCWWQEAAGRGRRFPHFPCEGFLGRGESSKYPAGPQTHFLIRFWLRVMGSYMNTRFLPIFERFWLFLYYLFCKNSHLLLVI